MNAGAGDIPLALKAPVCPQCARPMSAFDLEGHYGQQIATDLCAHCNVVWFDEFESLRLSGLGWITLLRRMHEAMDGGAEPLKRHLDCPRCGTQLKLVHNQTRFGRFASLECPRKHGHLQTFSLLLAERGLVRGLAHADLRTLADEHRVPCCLNCGSPIEGKLESCGNCASPLFVIDMPRLMTALLMRFGEPLPDKAGNRVAWACRGCGAALDPTHGASCRYCDHAVVVPSLADLRPVLDSAEPLLRAALPRQPRPYGKKLRDMRGDWRATSLHRSLRHLGSFLSGGGAAPNAVPGWVPLMLLVAAVWYFWS